MTDCAIVGFSISKTGSLQYGGWNMNIVSWLAWEDPSFHPLSRRAIGFSISLGQKWPSWTANFMAPNGRSNIYFLVIVPLSIQHFHSLIVGCFQEMLCQLDTSSAFPGADDSDVGWRWQPFTGQSLYSRCHACPLLALSSPLSIPKPSAVAFISAHILHRRKQRFTVIY